MVKNLRLCLLLIRTCISFLQKVCATYCPHISASSRCLHLCRIFLESANHSLCMPLWQTQNLAAARKKSELSRCLLLRHTSIKSFISRSEARFVCSRKHSIWQLRETNQHSVAVFLWAIPLSSLPSAAELAASSTLPALHRRGWPRT